MTEVPAWTSAIGTRRGSRQQGGRVIGLVGVTSAAAVWLVLLGPLGALLGHLSPGAIHRALSAPGAWAPLETSAEASLLALGILVVAGIPLARALARGRLPWPRLWEAGLLVPLVLPPLVIGLLLVFLIGPQTLVGEGLAHVGLTGTNSFVALVVAECYEAGPYFILGAAAAFAAVDPLLEQQAGLLGDGPWRTLRRVTLPLAAPGLASALAMGWARAIGAFGAVLIVAYHPFGLPLQIWTTLQEDGLAAALPFALLLVLVALPLPLAAYAWTARRRLEAEEPVRLW